LGSILDELEAAGARPYGSPALSLYEERLTRFFSREYAGLTESDEPLSAHGIRTDQGPMWQQTDALMSDHYDERAELFDAFLDSDLKAYTMAYYGETAEAVRASALSLEQAQNAKFDLISERAGVRGDERVFSIGCGFGPLETYLLRRYPDIRVTSITPSRVQAEYIRRRMASPSHPLDPARLSLIEGDFGACSLSALGGGAYDLVFAIGMFEHVNNLDAAFAKMAGLLRPGGRAFLHLIVSRPVFPQFMDSRRTLIGKYFPGGRIWPFREIERQTARFDLEGSWYLNGLNYWRTLDAWHRRFWEGMDRLYGKVLSLEGVRHWNDYFTLCKVVLFAPLDGSIYGNGHYLFRKKVENRK
jgi:cyclopropane-fatty-acyl-phospholipid synthase